ncbi:MAG: type II toxin-antitoxin system Phd/YefM family antitoxin [Gemmatimonadota bacterium]
MRTRRHRTAPTGGAPGERVSVTATEMKNRFGSMLDEVARGKAVVVTKHDGPRAVLISFDEYQALTSTNDADLDVLTAEFDALLAGMQAPAAAVAMRAAFGASSDELGRAAVAGARKRRGA